MENVIIAFCDGSCYNNGIKDKEQRAGIGVYFPGYQAHNISEALPFQKKTNNRAELYAIIRCLERVLEKPEGLPLNDESVVLIKSDSLLCVNTVTKWMAGWKKNGWIKGDGKIPENKDLLLRLDALLDSYPYEVRFQHMRGHQKEPKDKESEAWFDWFGNMISDKLAGDAARQ